MSAAALETRAAAEVSEFRDSIRVLDSENRPRKQADILVDIGKQDILFHDASGTAFAKIRVGTHSEVYPAESTSYKELLTQRYYELVGRGCNKNAVADALVTICSMAKFSGEMHPVYTRVAGLEAEIYIDTGSTDWSCIRVHAAGWESSTPTPPCFRRAGSPLPLPVPSKSPNFALLWKYANVCKEHRVLLAAFILAALRGVGPFPQLHLYGEQGSGKTILARVLKALIDPSTSPLRAPPKDIRDLLIGALNGHCLALDNVSYISPQLSDALCRLSTGGAISERQLYTNADEVLIEVQRPVIVNGIEDLAVRPDLAERGLHVELDLIKDRKPESSFWLRFHADAPHIFAAILNALVLCLRDHRTMRIGALPRMADFALWSAAGMPALGYTADDFMKAYRLNIQDGMSAGIDSSPVGSAIVKMLSICNTFTGTASDLLRILTAQADDGTKQSQSWPRSPRALSGVVRRLAPALRLQGISVDTTKAPDSSRSRLITLCYAGNRPSESSEPSEIAPETAPTSDGPDGPDGENTREHTCPHCDGEGCPHCESSI